MLGVIGSWWRNIDLCKNFHPDRGGRTENRARGSETTTDPQAFTGDLSSCFMCPHIIIIAPLDPFTRHFIRYTLLAPNIWIQFFLQRCFNSSWLRINKLLETFLRGFGHVITARWFCDMERHPAGSSQSEDGTLCKKKKKPVKSLLNRLRPPIQRFDFFAFQDTVL